MLCDGVLIFHSFVNTCDESGRVELGTEHFVGAIRQYGHTPITYKCDTLTRASCFDSRAEALGHVDLALPLHVDKDKVEEPLFEHLRCFVKITGGLNHIAGEPHDLVSQGAHNLALTDMQDYFL